MERNKHIAFFIPSFGGGGAEKITINLAKAFCERGFKVDLLTISANGPYLSLIPDTIRIIDFNKTHAYESLWKLVSYLKQNKPVALISGLSQANITALLARKLLPKIKTKFIITVHTTHSKEQKKAKSLKELLIPTIIRMLYPSADRVVAVSNGVAVDLNEFTKVPKGLIKVIYNPVVGPDLFLKALEPITNFPLPEGVPLILGIGRLSKEKNFAALIEAFAKVKAFSPAILILLGEGEERGALEGLVRRLGLTNDILMPGFIQNPYPFLVKARLFVLSSDFEGLPTALIEALALNVSIVSTNCESGPSEILRDGHLGVLVPPGDVAALSSAMLAALHTQKQQIQKEDWQKFTDEEAVKEYANLFGGL